MADQQDLVRFRQSQLRHDEGIHLFDRECSLQRRQSSALEVVRPAGTDVALVFDFTVGTNTRTLGVKLVYEGGQTARITTEETIRLHIWPCRTENETSRAASEEQVAAPAA